MSNQHTGLPNTPEEIRAFIGKNFSSLQFGQETEQPHENDTYTLTAHDLISAFQWFEIDAPVSAEQVGEVVLFGGDSDLKEVSWRRGKMPPPGTKLYTASAAAQPDVTQQTLDDVKAGIPARDAEIEALRKEIETLQSALDQPQRLIFPTMLRKMWSGSEVQAWLDDELAKLTKSSSQQDADKVNAWQCTTTLTESDDLIWLYCQDTNTIDGPVASSPEFIDSWTHWAWVKHPSTASIGAARKEPGA